MQAIRWISGAKSPFFFVISLERLIVFDPDVQDSKRGVGAKLPLRSLNCGI
jgi:hypothetical protein